MRVNFLDGPPPLRNKRGSLVARTVSEKTYGRDQTLNIDGGKRALSTLCCMSHHCAVNNVKGAHDGFLPRALPLIHLGQLIVEHLHEYARKLFRQR